MESWQVIQKELTRRISKERFDVFFGAARCVQLDAQGLVLEFANRWVRDWVVEHFDEVVQELVRELLGEGASAAYLIPGEVARTALTPPAAALANQTQGTLFDAVAMPADDLPHHNASSTAPDDGPVVAVAPAAGEPAAPTRARRGTAVARSGGASRGPVAGAGGRSFATLVADAQLGPHNTFEAFVEGTSNQFAYAAALAVAERPAEAYNPLFIYGGVGLGKTHLMQAIGLSIIERLGLRVCYRTSEQFMNELVAGIESRTMTAFRDRYRNQCDVLLIDDAQFMGGKERTQEEFFHTFNALHGARKQIILTCDRTPQEIPELEDRLVSRFTWGLMADIQRPDMETRIAIVNRKAALEGVALPADVAMFLASHVSANIRELEGALRGVIAKSRLERLPLTLALTQETLKAMNKERPPTLNADSIIKTVAGYFDLKPADIKGKSREKRVAYPRALAMFLSRKHSTQSYPDLGRAFGKDHSTVISAVQKVETLIAMDPTVAGDIAALERNLQA